MSTGPLSGLRVLSLAHVIAGPMAGSMLADFGADVVHVENPKGGDPAREMGHAKDGVFLWWKVAGRNKRSVTLDLRTPQGADIVKRLALWADVVICNMRPSTLAGWGIGWDDLRTVNPKLIFLQISGYGIEGPRSAEPGFGKAGEAQSGAVYVTGFPEGPPVFTGFSHADAVTGLMGAHAVMMALYRRNNDPNFNGELIDLALFEPLFRLIEWQVIGHDQLGIVFERSGNRPPMVPAAVVNTYKTADDVWLTVTSGTAASVLKIVDLLGLRREDFADVEAQRAASQLLDTKLREFVAAHTADEALRRMLEADVVASRIFSIADIMNDETYKYREDIITVDDPQLGAVKMQAAIPKMRNHPGSVWRTGAALGADNELVYKNWLGMPEAEYDALRHDGII
ncbi:MAG: CoA transferase [Candidatus Velthaea sp.]